MLKKISSGLVAYAFIAPVLVFPPNFSVFNLERFLMGYYTNPFVYKLYGSLLAIGLALFIIAYIEKISTALVEFAIETLASFVYSATFLSLSYIVIKEFL